MSTKFNYYEIISVTTSSFPTEPQVSFGFNSTGIILLNRGDAIVEYSFDGINLHGDLNPNDATVGVAFDNRSECKVFFRSVSTPQSVRVEAWA
jgi:hypothetical protein